MPADAIPEARRLLEERLRELEAEEKALRAALASLGADRRPSIERGRRSYRARAKRAPSGKRQVEFLAVLERTPGAKVPAIAEEIGIPKPQAYALARRLHQAGTIRKRRGGGYALKA